MNKFNIALFNLAINFNNGERNQLTPYDILNRMGEVVLEHKVITDINSSIVERQYLLLRGDIISIVEGSDSVATIKPVFDVVNNVSKHEDIFGYS